VVFAASVGGTAYRDKVFSRLQKLISLFEKKPAAQRRGRRVPQRMDALLPLERSRCEGSGVHCRLLFSVDSSA